MSRYRRCNCAAGLNAAPARHAPDCPSYSNCRPEWTYTTTPGESVMGIANRELNNSLRWTEIAELNADRFPGMRHFDYYPVGTVLRMPGGVQA